MSKESAVSMKIDFFPSNDGYWYWKVQRTTSSGTYESNKLGPYTDSHLVQVSAFRILDCMVCGTGTTPIRWTKLKKSGG